MIKNAKRIAVIGISASGKSTFSRQLAKLSQLPLYHMDTLFWNENWANVPDETWLKQEEEIIQTDEWIIEGYLDPKSSRRLSESDMIIYLDISGCSAFLNGLKRWFKHKGQSRPELPNCPERLDMYFLSNILIRKERGELEDILNQQGIDNVIRLKSQKQIDVFLQNY